MTAYSPNHRSLIRPDSTTKLQSHLTALMRSEEGLGCVQDMNLQKSKPLLQSIIWSLNLHGSYVQILVSVGIQGSCHRKGYQSKSYQRNKMKAVFSPPHCTPNSENINCSVSISRSPSRVCAYDFFFFVHNYHVIVW